MLLSTGQVLFPVVAAQGQAEVLDELGKHVLRVEAPGRGDVRGVDVPVVAAELEAVDDAELGPHRQKHVVGGDKVRGDREGQRRQRRRHRGPRETGLAPEAQTGGRAGGDGRRQRDRNDTEKQQFFHDSLPVSGISCRREVIIFPERERGFPSPTSLLRRTFSPPPG